jgi:hypothetical protein
LEQLSGGRNYWNGMRTDKQGMRVTIRKWEQLTWNGNNQQETGTTSRELEKLAGNGNK